METLLVIVWIVLALVLITLGANYLVDGSSSIAKKLGVSEFVIGLTIVALGTSSPEMVVSFIAAIEGNSDISMGNIIGSNIFNTAVILGISAIIAPILITKNNRKYDIPINVIVTLMLVFFGIIEGNMLTRLDATIFLLGFALYMFWSFKNDKRSRINTAAARATSNAAETTDAADKAVKIYSPFWSVVMIAGGLLGLIWGGQLFVNNAKTLAQIIGISDKVIAITVIAAGTSMPELATSVVAALKGRGQMALGNVLGSNTFNILLILGGSAMICPLSTANINYLDYMALAGTSLLLMVFTFFKKDGLNKIEGALLLLLGVAYMTALCF